MNRTAVSSSNIASIGYDPATQILEVEFLDGSVYQYLNVPPPVHHELMTASSHGKYLNAEIKPHYQYRKL